jgi:hypothetical protein
MFAPGLTVPILAGAAAPPAPRLFIRFFSVVLDEALARAQAIKSDANSKFPPAQRAGISIFLTTPFMAETYTRVKPRGTHAQPSLLGDPSTQAEDGDPLDTLIVHDAATYPGLVLACAPVGVLEALQHEKGKSRSATIGYFTTASRRANPFDRLRPYLRLSESRRCQSNKMWMSSGREPNPLAKSPCLDVCWNETNSFVITMDGICGDVHENEMRLLLRPFWADSQKVL